MAEHHSQEDTTPSLSSPVPFHRVSLRGEDGERRLPTDIVRKELFSLPRGTWIEFFGDELGDLPAYAADLIRRLVPLQCPWIARANLRFAQVPALVKAAQRSGCRGLIFDGGSISAHHLTSEPAAVPDALPQMIAHFRTLTQNGVLSIVHFVFGYDTDDEGVFERTVRFCLDARIGLPHFSLLTPTLRSVLHEQLAQEGRLLQTDTTLYDGAHAVFQPKFMTAEALENGLRWTRQQVYRPQAIWQRTLVWNRATFRHLLANYAQKRLFRHEAPGAYTEAMRLLSQLSQPIFVKERASFISTLKDAVGETRRHLQGALLRTRATRNESLKALTLRLEGVLDASGAKEVLRRIHAAIRAGHQKVVLDLRGLESVSPTVITRFLEENAQALIALRERVVFRHLHTILAAIKENLGGVLPNAELFESVSDES